MIDKHDVADAIKKVLFPFGEPYQFAGKTLRFKAGSRPIKRKYISSGNYINRNDVLQINYLEKNFKASDVLWDIGSHHGHYSIFAATTASGNRQVFSFEPEADARKVQEQNIRLNNFVSKISVSPIAISATDGYEHFASEGGNANAHIVKGGSDRWTYKIVQSKTLNTLLSQCPVPTFIKIDTEGAEIDILSEAGRLLENKSITFICELHPFAWEYFNKTFDDLLSILNRYNRKISFIDPEKTTNDLPFYGTVIF